MARILIAEDEAFTAMALVDGLQERGHAVRDAADGALAIAAFDLCRPDVLVTDLMMPNVDGADLIRHVRRTSGAGVGVILISGVPEAKLPAGLQYDAYLGKPVDHDALAALVDDLAGRTA